MKRLHLILITSLALVGLAAIGVVSAQDSNTANIEVRVWQNTGDAESLYISARPESGSWATLGTIPLDMSGLTSRGTYRYGDITVAVPIGGPAIDDSEPCSALQQALQGRSEFSLVSCVGVYHPSAGTHDAGWAVWNASGMIRVGVRELRYSGGYPAGTLERGFSILWDLADEGYPCIPVIRDLEAEFGVRIFRCNASGAFSTVDGANYSISGRAFDATNEYYFSARIKDDLTLDHINWHMLVPVWSE